MANNTTLDSQMLIASQLAYSISDTGSFSSALPDGFDYVIDGTLQEADRINLGTGFKVIAFKSTTPGSHEYIISFRGTDPTSTKDWYSDGQLGWNQWSVNDLQNPQAVDGEVVLDYINEVLASDPQATFHITGHSLGGGLAQYAAYYAKLEERRRQETDPSFQINLTLTTFNGFGVLDTLTRRETTTADAINTTLGNMYAAHYIANGDLVSLLGGGHVGETTNGTLNTYALGSTTKFFLDAHYLANDAFANLSLAQSHNFASEYLKLQTTQGVLAKIASLGDGDGLVSSPGAALRVMGGLIVAVQAGDRQEIDQLGDWLAKNLFDAGFIDLDTYLAAARVDWGLAGKAGNIIAIARAAALVGIEATVEDALLGLKNWAGNTADALVTAVRADLDRYIETVGPALSDGLGRDVAGLLEGWEDSGYDAIEVLEQSQAVATQLQTNPAALQATVETNPLSFLPVLTAPDPTDYTDDPGGEAAYQTALTLYNNKLTERTQLQTLYNQYITDTDALSLLPANPTADGDPATWQVIINGDAAGDATPDNLTANPTTTHLYGLAGDDVLSGRAGIDGSVEGIQIYGGTGNDILHGEYHHGGWSETEAQGYTQLYYHLGPEEFANRYSRVKPGLGAILYGEAGLDRMHGSLQDDTLDGGLDPDHLDAYLGNDTALGGDGHDLINGHEGQDSLDGNDGDDRIGGGEGADHLQGGMGDDQLYGDSRYTFLTWSGLAGTLVTGTLTPDSFPVVQDALEADAGDDVLEGHQGQDELYGGAGDDLLDGGTENDQLQGEGGDDILFGANGDDRLWGDSAEDAVTTDAQLFPGDYGTYTYYWRSRRTGMDGNDYLDGGAGDDNLWGGGGEDHLVGGIGIDWLMGGLGNGSVSGHDVLEGGDDGDFLFGEDGDDTLRGNAGDDEQHGGDGNDGLFGGTENDVLHGDAGSDVLHGEDGDDYLDGGAGDDTLFGGEGIDTLIGGPGRDVIYAGDGNDTIVSDSEDDLIFGELGDDVIDGGAGNDEIYGGAGLNRLIGGLGNDVIFGGSGNDVIEGGAGDDVIDGGGGNDTFHLAADNDTYVNTTGDNTYVIALGPDVPDGFSITINDTAGTDTLRFESVSLGINPATGLLTYLRPVLASTSKDGDDLVLNVQLEDEFANTPDPLGTVRLTDFNGPGRIEQIEIGVESYGFVDPSVISPVQGPQPQPQLYLKTATSGPYYLPFGYSYGNVQSYLLIGSEADDLLTDFNVPYAVPGELRGYAGNDLLAGGDFDDLLNGGTGNDTLHGSGGADTYFFSRGDGQDRIYDRDYPAAGLDTLLFDWNIQVPDVTVSHDQNDVLLSINGTGDRVTLEDWMRNAGRSDYVERIVFDSGTVWDAGYIGSLVGHDFLSGGLDADILDGTALHNGIEGREGNDHIHGHDGDDSLYGDAGDDQLHGDSGDDWLIGGAGNDQLFGGLGSDTYFFDRLASGVDIVTEEGGNSDILVLDALPFEVSLTIENLDLVVNFTATGNRVVIADWYLAEANRLEYFQMADILWDRAAIDDHVVGSGLIINGTEGDDALNGSPGIDQIDGRDGNDEIDGFAGNDILRGGAGEDSLYGQADDDILDGGPGNDWLSGGSGNNVFIGGAGDDGFSGLDADNDGFVDNTFVWNHGDGIDEIIVQATRSLQYGYGDMLARTRDDLMALAGFTGDVYVNDYYWEQIVDLDRVHGLPAGLVAVFTQMHSNIDGVELGGVSPAAALEALAALEAWFLDGDAVQFGEGIAITDIKVQRSLDNFEFTVEVGADAGVVVRGGDATPVESLALRNFVLADGQEYSLDQILALADGILGYQEGTNGDDIVRGSIGDDEIFAGAGNDVVDGRGRDDYLEGEDGDDVLIGAGGDDELYGDAGNDIFIGGTGGDYLEGAAGGDIYLFNSGDNSPSQPDYITESAELPGTTDVDYLSFGGGISPGSFDAYLEVSQFSPDDIFTSLVLINRDAQARTWIDWSYTHDPGTGPVTEDYRIERAQFLGSGNDRVYDFAGLIATRYGDLLNATEADPIPLFRPEDLLVFDLTSQVPFAGGAHARQYATIGTIPFIPSSNELTGSTGDDVLDGTSGNDLIVGLTGNDMLSGGGGDDTYRFNLGDGVDTINDLAAPGESNRIVFGPGITSGMLSLGIGSLLIRVGNQGEAIHLANFDPSDVYGPRAIETFEFADGTVLSYAELIERGFDLTGTEASDILTGTNGADRIQGLAGLDMLMAGAGNDTLDGGTGADHLAAGPGDDILHYSADDVWSTGFIAVNGGSPGVPGTGSRAVIAGRNRSYDVFDGGDGYDILVGSDADDALALDDQYSPFPGVIGPRVSGIEAIYGNGGNDVIDLTSGIYSYGDILLDGGPGDDVLWSSAGQDTLQGGDGNDILYAGAGNDIFFGGAGNDTLDGGPGADAMTGNMGNDIYLFDNPGDTVTELPGEGTDTVKSAIDHALGVNLENLTLTGTADLNGWGNDLNNVITGNAGMNNLAGGRGNDVYVIGLEDTVTEIAGEGTDTVRIGTSYMLGDNIENLVLTGTAAADAIGNVLNNALTGNAANNRLNGGVGNDTLRGGLGDDTYVFEAGWGVDTVVENDGTLGNTDSVLFGSGIGPLDIVFTRSANNLRVTRHESADTILVKDWYLGTPWQTEVFRGADGSSLLDTQVDQLIQAMAQFSASHGGISWDQAIDQNPTEVQAVLTAYWQPVSG